MAHRILFLFLFLTPFAYSSEVIQATKNAMAISQAPDRPYRIDDAICVVRDNKKIACGRVSKATPKGAIVRLIVVKTEVVKGDIVIRVTSRQAASGGESSDRVVPSAIRKNGLGGGYLYTAAYSNTLVFYERALSNQFSLRIEPNYFAAVAADNSYTVAALGGKIGFSFDSIESFKGFWVNLGVGYYSFAYVPVPIVNSNSAASFGTLVASALFGFRFKLGQLFSLGLGIGGQYLPFPADKFPESAGTPSVQFMANANLGLLF